VQIIVAIPEAGSANERSYASLAHLISGVPLLVRTLATAQRAGADEILLLAPKSMSLVMANAFIEYPSLRNKGGIRLVQVKSLNPDEPSDWLELQHRLEEHFIWLPWNWVTDGCLLANLPKCAQWGNNWTAPRWVSKTAVTRRPNGTERRAGLAARLFRSSRRAGEWETTEGKSQADRRVNKSGMAFTCF
jgi:hypothetical protein